jgi:hypothetical protein
MTQRESKRRRLLQLLKQEEPIGKDADHPELEAGAAARFERIQQQRDRD